MGTCQLLAQKQLSVQEGREDSQEMKSREWEDTSYLLLPSVSSEGDQELARTQLIHQLLCCSQDANMYSVY